MIKAQQVAKGLGWFSVGTGLLEIVSPGTLTRLLGVSDHSKLVRAYGGRELLAGVGLLTQPRAAALWVWFRVAGDVLDLATVGVASPDDPASRKRTASTLAMLTAVTVTDVLCARALSARNPLSFGQRLLERSTS